MVGASALNAVECYFIPRLGITKALEVLFAASLFGTLHNTDSEEKRLVRHSNGIFLSLCGREMMEPP